MTYFKIRNLKSADVTTENPWDWDSSSVDFDMDKKSYRNTYLYDAQADHFLVSAVEGELATQRVSAGKHGENPPCRVHGFIADYDGVYSDAIIEELRHHPPSEYLPAWYVITQSKKLRLVWEFESPISVTGSEHADKFLAELGCRLSARKWGSDYDKVSEKSASYFDIGRSWHRFSGYEVPTSILQLWDYKVFSKIREGYASVTTEIPFDVIQQEISERWPGRFAGTVKEGEHCCRFWDPDSDNDRGCTICKDGVRVYVPHDKPFMSWRDIFGPSFVDKYVSAKLSPIVQNMWFNSSTQNFVRWKESDQSYVPRNDTTARRDLIIEAGLSPMKKKGENFSEVEQALHDITTRREVAWAAPIIYMPHGPRHLSNSERTLILNTSLTRVMQPVEELWTTDWSWRNPEVRDRFPFIYGLVTTMFEQNANAAASRFKHETFDVVDEANNVQLQVFLGWLSYFYRTSGALHPAQGQCLVLAGQRNIGKSFFARYILGPLMGGITDAEQYYIDGTKYTGDIIKSPVHLIDDKIAELDRRGRAAFVTRLKSVCATATMRYEEKFRNSVESLPWYGRVLITCNMDARSLSVLPDLEQSNRDKIIMLKLGPYRYHFRDRAENMLAIRRELPYFARFLNQYTFDDRFRDNRMGVVAYQHPEMIQAAAENGYIRTVIEALRMVIDSLRDGGDDKVRASGSGELRGSARSLYDLISTVSPSAAREIGSARQLAQNLQQLMATAPVTKRRTRATFEWIIPFDFDTRMYDDDHKEEEGIVTDGQ